MININALKKVGIGTYRMTIEDPDHLKVLNAAIDKGCNLIDTATNYKQGNAERLVGEAVSGRRKECFIISKGGYLTKSSASEELNDNIAHSITEISDQYLHSIHPYFLEKQLLKSYIAIKTDYLDAFMVHNPEYQYRSRDKDQVYDQIEDAFKWLTQKCKEGRIRYYGLSSNTLTNLEADGNTISLDKIHQLAKKVGGDNYFKFIQFPFNIFENSATIRDTGSNLSLIDKAKSYGITTIGNRPLNANYNGVGVRLAEYKCSSNSENVLQDWLDARDELCTMILNNSNPQLPKENSKIIKYLMIPDNIDNLQYHSKVLEDHIKELLSTHFISQIPKSVNDAYQSFLETGRILAMSNVNSIALQLKQKFVDAKIIPPNSDELLQNLLCKAYINSGIDHVLVGMRKMDYLNLLSI